MTDKVEFYHKKEYRWILALYSIIFMISVGYVIYLFKEDRYNWVTFLSLGFLILCIIFFVIDDKKKLHFFIEKTDKEIKITRFHLFKKTKESIYDKEEILIIPLGTNTICIDYISEKGLPKRELLYVKERYEEMSIYLNDW